MELYQAKQINDHTYIIGEDYGTRANTTMALVIGKKRAALIDTGAGIADLSKFVKRFTELPVVVLTTHLHADHAGGNPFFEEIYVSEEDVFLMPESMGMDFRMNYIRQCLGEDNPRKAEIERTVNRILSFPYHPLSDGDQIDLGGVSLKTVALPGHTPGSMMFFDETTHTLFSGDAVNTTPWLFLPYSAPLCVYLKNLKRLRPLFAETEHIYCGHDMNDIGTDVPEALMLACEDVLNGERGRPVRTFAGEAYQYRRGKIRLFFRPDNLVSGGRS
ncbi:MBL fold metallo-hydrolase [Massilimaliae timonensis]|uniref:MBL fold metallo-hydrolase n=1 Tax=Massiliimalia timonensis TaxID=1987501 RepID=A0A8J6PDN8_9FIRM|nr:MBL fold metallo-hydrolase [Massiliimalia timonensis]MBC8610232.1 MBL fold metallo-hydrolase [Massiliimalia timonensis]